MRPRTGSLLARDQETDLGASGQPPLGPLGRRVGMALYGDLTYDSRVRKEARTLAQAGYQVTILCLASHGGRSDLPENVDVMVLEPSTKAVIPGSPNPFVAAPRGRIAVVATRVVWLVTYIRGLRAWGRRAVEGAGAIDTWHAHDLTGLAAVVPFLRRDATIVYDSHELFLAQGTASRLPRPIRRLLRAYEGRLVSRTSSVITVNDEIANVLRRRYKPTRIAVVHNCPDRWTPPARRPFLIHEAVGIPRETPIVLYHGGLTGGRGIERLMEALLVDGLEDVHLALMGYGDKREEFRSIAESARWHQRIHVLDPVPPSALMSWVASADVGAMPNPGLTRNDIFSSPNKLFECFAAGTPVIASDFATMRRIVVDNPGGPLGAVCDPSSVESIADAIRSILRLEPVRMDELRSRCLQAAAERWNWEEEAEKLLSVYSGISPRLD